MAVNFLRIPPNRPAFTDRIKLTGKQVLFYIDTCTIAVHDCFRHMGNLIQDLSGIEAVCYIPAASPVALEASIVV